MRQERIDLKKEVDRLQTRLPEGALTEVGAILDAAPQGLGSSVAAIGVYILNVLGTRILSPSMFNSEFFRDEMNKYALCGCSLATDWLKIHASRYSDPQAALMQVLDASMNLIQDWHEVTHLGSLYRAHDVDLKPRHRLSSRMQVAMGRSRRYAKMVVWQNLGLRDATMQVMRDRKWDKRPQGLLLTGMSCLYLEALVTILCASADIMANSKTSKYLKYLKEGRSVLVGEEDWHLTDLGFPPYYAMIYGNLEDPVLQSLNVLVEDLETKLS